jgi:Na+/proline symporter
MKAVIWTDVLQAIVILIGLLAAIIQGKRMIKKIFDI